MTIDLLDFDNFLVFVNNRNNNICRTELRQENFQIVSKSQVG